MFEKAAEILKKYAGSDGKLCVAVSGGKDSMCLLDFLLKRSDIDKRRICAVNIDHGIRGESSVKDSAFVKDYCAAQGVEFHGFRIDVPGLCAVSGRSEETEAREARYGIFCELIKSGAAHIVMTAHHALDNVETVLMHLFRGSGINGLKGMDVFSRGYILRPLLTTEKHEIDEYANTYGVPFVTDETNADSAYGRNFVRNEVLPLIASRWRGVERAVTRLGQEARQTSEYLDSLVCKYVHKSENGAEISADAELDAALAGRTVMCAFKAAGLNHDAERKHAEDVAALLSAATGAAVDLPRGFRAEKSYGSVRIFRPSDEIEKSAETVPFVLGEMRICGKSVFAETVSKPDFSEKGALFIDKKALPPDACIRTRRDGDRFRPFGGGEKKLKDWFIDKKIPKAERDFIPLITSGDRVLAVSGFEISDSVRICDGSEIIKITVSS